MKKLLTLLVLAGISCSALAQQKASYREFTEAYTTYPFSDPDPIPAKPKLYPYFRFDGFTSKAVRKKWKVVELENDYIKVKIMPEIGGKVWTAYDKVNKKHFLYNNEVVKFRDIAMRGPWVSGGIEANYGIIGHTPNSATPVDYKVITKEDGSVSCIVSVLDLLTRTRWVLDINLEKDKGYFTTRSYWFNQTGMEQPYYTWMNAGGPAGDDLKFLYPGDHYIGHDGKAHNWPEDAQGRDLSLYSENDFKGSKSYHVLGAYSKYFGALWKDQDYGMIRYSNRGDKLGKKIFLWAQSGQGKIWENLLTDNSGQYVELQSGRLYNQNVDQSSETPFKQIGFTPYANDSWKEYWYPFGNINGFTHANSTGAFNISLNQTRLDLQLSPVKSYSGHMVLLDKKGHEVHKEAIEIEPLHPYEKSIKVPENAELQFIQIGDDRIDLSAASQKTLSRPVSTPAEFDAGSYYGLYLMGRDYYNFRKYPLAEKTIKASLEGNAYFVPSLVEMAKIKYFKMEYDSAFYYSKKALSIDTYNGGANYLYGLSADKTARFYDALDGYEVAALTPQNRNAAYTRLGHLYFKKNNLARAEEYATLALDDHSRNMDALQVLYVLARLKGDMAKMAALEKRIVALNPLSHFVRFEHYFQTGSEKSRTDFTALIRNEMPVETYLEMAIWYGNLGRADESVALLELAPKNALTLYWLSFRSDDKDRADKYFQEAEKMPLDYVFPFREETATMLEQLRSKRNSWKVNYLLALVHAFKNNKEKSNALLNETEVKFAPYYIIKERVDEGADIKTRLAYLDKAMKLAPGQWRYKILYSKLLEKSGSIDRSIAVLEKQYRKTPDNYVAGLDLTRLYMKNDEYAKAEAVLSRIRVLPFEGATDSRRYYRQTKLMLAYKAYKKGQYKKALQKLEESEAWPENLGVGKPYQSMIDSNLENSMRVYIYQKLKDKEHGQQYRDLLTKEPVNEAGLKAKIEQISFKEDEYLF
ncbi:DUF5107 domain-containing protein [Sinomicrobium weinanense]|uniref:DUF5107 domain-containing protein n=1 Tax=Sinomicrobium weinanense TaxID=2842200 RepID=A0A926JSN2_9FLAO|nr:DUF5107 domain-containing protein [Sinomicrobium weinanense]MBC9796787.1 DUF5107 domain-containing protein [Sinomicrobium weinanense]MBU3125526.1 DUF5107 domain-containing protein [Sinomicrobium weinanense]